METDDVIRHLDEQECWDRVAAAPYGRLALSVFDDVDIVPINAVLSRGDLFPNCTGVETRRALGEPARRI